MPEEIQKIQTQILPILKQAGVLRSSLFGSVARGESDEKSDVDILVELPRGKSLFDLFDLQDKLQAVLGKKVDIGTYRSIKPMLKDRILKEQVEIYARQ
jgi:predicted nucleotidyltransferase